MPESREPQVFRLEPGRAADPLRYRNDAGGRRRFIDIARYQGPALPAALTDPVVEGLDHPDPAMRSWRIRCAEGRFEFRALAVERIEECAVLHEPLHRPFRLRTSDRLAVRVLLWLLRLPGGAGLLRRWHAHRH